MTKESNKLNDLSQAELAHYRELARQGTGSKNRNCEHCGKLTSMRADQRFCSPKCRIASHNELGRILQEKLKDDIERLTEENNSLKTLLKKNGIAYE
jgi:hypothetical protein